MDNLSKRTTKVGWARDVGANCLKTTIPQDFIHILGIKKGDRLTWELKGDKVTINDSMVVSSSHSETYHCDNCGVDYDTQIHVC